MYHPYANPATSATPSPARSRCRAHPSAARTFSCSAASRRIRARLVRTAQTALRLGRELDHPLQMTVTRRVVLVSGDESLLPVVDKGLQQSVTRAVVTAHHRNQGLIHQMAEDVDDVTGIDAVARAHGLGGTRRSKPPANTDNRRNTRWSCSNSRS